MGYWEQLVGHIVIFTASLVNQILQYKLSNTKVLTNSPQWSDSKLKNTIFITQRLMWFMYLLICHSIVSTRWLSCWWCWSAWEGPWWMIGPGRACSTWSTSNKVLGTWYLQYLVLGIWCFQYYINSSNWYLGSEVLGLHQATFLVLGTWSTSSNVR